VILAATNKWKGGLQAGAGRKPPRLFTLVETHEKQMTAKTANGVPYRRFEESSRIYSGIPGIASS
jgi:hypothetical protein